MTLSWNKKNPDTVQFNRLLRGSQLEKSQEVKTSLEEFMSGDAIVLCSLITSLPAGLVPIMSASSQLSSALLSFPLPCPQLASFSPQNILISTCIAL